MTVTSVEKDLEELTLTLTADFDGSVAQVWQLWADPRLLERWWGPPTYPATFERHELVPGGEVAYFMTGPEGDRHHGYWKVLAVDAPNGLDFKDGFADADGNPATEMGENTVQMRLTTEGDRTRMVLRSSFVSKEQLEQQAEMGMEEGLRQAVGQMDDLLTQTA